MCVTVITTIPDQAAKDVLALCIYVLSYCRQHTGDDLAVHPARDAVHGMALTDLCAGSGCAGAVHVAEGHGLQPAHGCEDALEGARRYDQQRRGAPA